MATQTSNRHKSVRVKLSADMANRLDALALDHGMPTATFAAFCIGQWVRREEKQQSLIADGVKVASERIGEDLADLDLEGIAKRLCPSQLVALTSIFSGEVVGIEGESIAGAQAAARPEGGNG